MKYETPELTALTPAINAIHSTPGISKGLNSQADSQTSPTVNDVFSAYADWE